MSLPPTTPDPRDERGLMGLTAGVLWLVAALTTAVGALMPGSPHVVGWVFAGLEVFMVAYAIGCIAGWIPWESVSMRSHAITTAALYPLIGVGVWATGGGDSFIYPMLLFPLLYAAYFFSPRVGMLLVGELVLIYAAPLVYTDGAAMHAFPGRALTFAVTALVLAGTVRLLKNRLLEAEARQRQMARTDALTGLVNRRGFDDALHAVVAGRGDAELGRRAADEDPPTILVLIDLDNFKGVNDSLGHAAGDDLLRAVAAHCNAVVRPGDTLARIGGDEFALIAPAAGTAGAARLATGLCDAIGAAGSTASIAWAAHPDDGESEDALLRAADRRLYERKAALREARRQAEGPPVSQ